MSTETLKDILRDMDAHVDQFRVSPDKTEYEIAKALRKYAERLRNLPDVGDDGAGETA